MAGRDLRNARNATVLGGSRGRSRIHGKQHSGHLSFRRRPGIAITREEHSRGRPDETAALMGKQQ